MYSKQHGSLESYPLLLKVIIYLSVNLIMFDMKLIFLYKVYNYAILNKARPAILTPDYYPPHPPDSYPPHFWFLNPLNLHLRMDSLCRRICLHSVNKVLQTLLKTMVIKSQNSILNIEHVKQIFNSQKYVHNVINKV